MSGSYAAMKELGYEYSKLGNAGIETTTANSKEGNIIVYDLQGRHVAQPTRGLYIVNNKKVFIK